MNRLLAMLLLASLTFFGGKKQPSIGSIEGIVLDNGVPIKATIRILRDGYPGIPNYETVVLVLVTRHFAGSGAMTFPVDAPGMYHLTTDKKGHFAHFGLPVGGYSVGIEVNGLLVERASGLKVDPGGRTRQSFDITLDQKQPIQPLP